MKFFKHIIGTAVLTLAATLSLHANPAETWNQHCVRCHGPDGKGFTKMGRKLRIKDLTSDKVRERLTEERIIETIEEGKQDASGNERMPSFKEKLQENERRTLAGFVRSLGTQSSVSSAD